MFLMRSWVMGRGGEILSSSSAMALASKSPTQMGSERLASSSPRMSMGMLESGSSASPLTFISSHMVPLLVLAGGPDMDPCSPPSTLLSSSHTLRQRNRRQGVLGIPASRNRRPSPSLPLRRSGLRYGPPPSHGK